MASDNRAYTQFDDTGAPPAHYGTTMPNTTTGNGTEAKNLKQWKNSKRLCWALLIISIVTLILEIIGAGISGVHLDWLLGRFIAGVWLAALGVISASLGLRAFRNAHQSSKCWTITHFVMCILSTIAYFILLLMAIADIIGAREAIEDYYLYIDSESMDSGTQEQSGSGDDMDVPILNSTMAANVTTPPSDMDAAEALSLLNAVKGDLTISVFLLGTTIAFFIISIISNVVICRNWCRNRQKTMTIVYMPHDQSGNPQTQSIVVPAKTQVVVVPAPKSAPTDQHQLHLNRYNGI
jgi:hypothetical protein